MLGALSPVRLEGSTALLDENTKLEESGKTQLADRILREEVGDNEGLRAGLITALAADIHEGGENSLFETETFDNSRELASEASEALSSARHYEVRPEKSLSH